MPAIRSNGKRRFATRCDEIECEQRHENSDHDGDGENKTHLSLHRDSPWNVSYGSDFAESPAQSYDRTPRCQWDHVRTQLRMVFPQTTPAAAASKTTTASSRVSVIAQDRPTFASCRPRRGEVR